MNNEQFTAYLQDESYLYTLSYEELKTLVIQYPYAANLRILLLKKAYLEQHKDYERVLNMAATYTTHRKQLWQMLKSLKTLQSLPENVILGEDHLELSALSDIERLLQNRQVVEAFGSTEPPALEWQWSLEAGADDAPLATEPEEPVLLDFSATVLQPLPVVLPETAPEGVSETPESQLTEGGASETPLDTAAATDTPTIPEVIPMEIANPIGARLIGDPMHTAAKKQELSFTEWLKQFKIDDLNAAEPPKISEENPHVTALETLNEGIETDEDMRRISQDRMLELFDETEQLPDNLFTFGRPTAAAVDDDLSDLWQSSPPNPTEGASSKKKKKKKRDMHVLAVRSLETSDDLISETLADILVAQEKYQEAVEMYRKLILQFPEKSDYFAAKIEKVRT